MNKPDNELTPAQLLGRAGGKKRAASLTPEQRSAISRLGAQKRWENTKGANAPRRSPKRASKP